MKTLHFTLLVFMAILMGISCTKDTETHVDAELMPYFGKFSEEATTRAFTVSLDQISGSLEYLDSNATLGQCKKYSDGSREVVINLARWDQATELEKEKLVFHELGHCILNRAHTEEADENGICKSIMNSGLGSCQFVYSNANRTALLDELFYN